MDIGSGSAYPSCALSNFPPQPFVFDGVECASREGGLQAFKFDKPHIQVEVCKLVGLAAKRRGRPRNKAWQRVQKLWWKDVEYDRHGPEYQDLLNRFFAAAFENSTFRRALVASGSASLTHSIGRRDPSETVLTVREFCTRLSRLRILAIQQAHLEQQRG